jgi:hypothetical protein
MRLKLIAVLLLAHPLAASAACGIAGLGVAEVAAVRDDATLLLQDGRAVEPGPAPQPLLVTLTQGRTIRLSAAAQPETNRYGRVLAFVRAEEGGLQEALLARGAARVSVRAGGRTCAEILLKLEKKQVRDARVGLWAEPNFAPLRAEPGTSAQERLGTFVLVEGTVVPSGRAGARFTSISAGAGRATSPLPSRAGCRPPSAKPGATRRC